MQPFELTTPLPEVGTTVLEASAGTGKTWTLAALATRFVAEGAASLDELLLITFSRAATQELRDRVREAFVRTAAGLGGDEPAGSADVLVDVVARDADGRPLDAAALAVRRERLLAAIARYDTATIATTHEFCHAVLRSLGVAGNADARERLREDISGLADEVIADHFLTRWAERPVPPVDFRDARRAANEALENVHAELRPLGLDPETPGGALVAFAAGVREEVETRKRRGRVFTFDDILIRLAQAVTPEPGAPAPPASERMRERWRVVLVDEFQDTDPVQWAILRHAFAEHARLLLIGDPKQAIYAFRGGDTPTYLEAVAGAEARTLDRNFRSDPAVVEGLQALLRGAWLGDERIQVLPVRAAREESSLVGGAQAGTAYSTRSGVRLRRIARDGFDLTKDGGIRAADWRSRVARDLAADVARQLQSGARIRDGESTRPLSAGDVAILLHSVRREGPAIQAELSRLGIPWVVNSAESVMTGPAATAWLRLLEAMEQPSLPRRVRAAALTPFFAATAEELVAGGDGATDRLAERIRSWLDLWRSRGIAAVLAAAQADGLAARVLAFEGGERLLTDLNHVGELLHRAAQEERLGLTGVIRWLREAIEEGNRTDTRRRRLDVDAEAVQLVTIHGSKGLEYPIVYLPGLFDRSVPDWITVHAYHEAQQDREVRCLDVANSPDAQAAARAEDAQEDLRLAYVAMTRARAQVVLWWAPTYNASHAALTRLLFGRGPGGGEVPVATSYGATDAATDAVLRTWESAGAFRLEDAVVATVGSQPPTPVPALTARRFDRALDLAWRRTSYSGLIRAEDLLVSVHSEPEEAGTVDEDEPSTAEEPTPLAPAEDSAGGEEALPSPMAELSGGATFGSLVHAVLEVVDPETPDLRAEVLRHVEEQRRWWSVPATSEALAEALLPLQHTSLGPLAGGRTLAEIPLRDRLCELDFEIPLADGDRPVAPGASAPGRRLGEFADALRRHLPAGDPVLPYAEKLLNPSLGDQVLRGYLSGSIDAVLRVESAGVPRFVVVDYKTNTLGQPGRPSTVLDYTPDAVAEAMGHSHYPLQALLYSVVLHRYLRWRLPGYDPDVHLGGVLYLYVRGMAGPETPAYDGVPCGVFSWQPPSALVLELSDLLAGGGS